MDTKVGSGDGFARWVPADPLRKTPVAGHGPVGPPGPQGPQGPPGPVTSIGIMRPGDKLIIAVTADDEVMIQEFLNAVCASTGLSQDEVVILINADSVTIVQPPVPDEDEIVEGLREIHREIQVIGGE